MKNQLKRKLRSNQGMTLLLSLLLFLVCAVAGSVALTAGTATSGTISERAKLDQRYFSVTSAAELIRKEFGQDVQDISVTLEYDNSEKLKSFVPPTPTSSKEDFIIKHSLRVLDTRLKGAPPDKGDPDWPQDPDWHPPGAADENPVEYQITAVQKIDGEPDKPLPTLNANVTVTPDDSGLQFTVSSNIERTNAQGQPIPDGTFSLNMPYIASVRKGTVTTTKGREVTFHVKWEIGTISY